MKRQVRCSGKRISINGEMTVYTAATVGKQVMARITDKSNTETIDLAAVTEMDTAGLQILLMARRAIRSRGRELRISADSEAVRGVMELLQLTNLSQTQPTETGS